MDATTKAQLAEVLDRTPADDEPVDALIVEALHRLWHTAPSGRGWGRPCQAADTRP